MARNKTEAVLEWLQAGNTITDAIAVHRFDAHRLGDVIFRLRKAGHSIETMECEKKDRYGRSVKFAEYRLIKEEEPQNRQARG